MLFVPTQAVAQALLEHVYLGPEFADRQSWIVHLATKAARAHALGRRATDRYLFALGNGVNVTGFGRISINLASCVVAHRGSRNGAFDVHRLVEHGRAALCLADALWGTDAAAIGVDGLADALLLAGYSYGSRNGRGQALRWLWALRVALFDESVRLAARYPDRARRDSPLLADERLMARLSPAVRAEALRYGVRHTGLVAIRHDPGPAIAFGNGIAPGLLPVFAPSATWYVDGINQRCDSFAVLASRLYRLPIAPLGAERVAFEQMFRALRRLVDGPLEMPSSNMCGLAWGASRSRAFRREAVFG